MTTETKYCYHCRVHHPTEETRLISTKTGKRWRCLRSIAATRISREARAEFGRSVSASNLADTQSRAKHVSEFHLDQWNRR